MTSLHRRAGWHHVESGSIWAHVKGTVKWLGETRVVGCHSKKVWHCEPVDGEAADIVGLKSAKRYIKESGTAPTVQPMPGPVF